MPVTTLPIIIIIVILFAIAFNISIWVGLFFAVWLIASITWLLIALDTKSESGKWYDWFIGTPVLIIAYIWTFVDKIINKNEKNKN